MAVLTLGDLVALIGACFVAARLSWDLERAHQFAKRCPGGELLPGWKPTSHWLRPTAL